MRTIYLDGKKMIMREQPLDLEPGEALVKVSLAGICGTDLEMARGYMSFSGVLGHEFVGIVEKANDQSLVGKRVVGEINAACGKCDYCGKGLERHCPKRTVLGIYRRDGAFAEYVSLPEKNLHQIPDRVADEQAVFVEPIAAAFEIEEQIHTDKDSRVAIVGDGRLAQLIARVMRIRHGDMVCFGRHQSKLERLRKLGIKTKLEILPEDEHQFDVVVEATGRESGFSDALRLARPRGTVVLKSTIASKEKLDFAPAIINEITMVGSRCGPFRPAIEALASGKVTVDDLVSAVYPLEEFEKAFEEAKNPESLKVLLRP